MKYFNIRNPNLTFSAKLTTDQTADFSIGSSTGVLVGTAIINNNQLEILNDTTGWLEYNAVSNCDSPQVGTILFKFIPNFNNSDDYGQAIFYCSKGEGDQTNQINLAINPSEAGGGIIFQANNAANESIFSDVSIGYPFVLGTEYIIQINYDFTTGSTKLYIDGEQFGSTHTETGTRDTNITLFRFGCGWDAYSSSPSNFAIDDICIFKTVQDVVSDYEIGYEFTNPNNLTTLIKLYGNIYNANLPVEGVEVKVRPYQAGFANPAITGTGIFQYYAWTSFGVTYFDGYFEGLLYCQPTSKYWEIKIGSQSYYVTLPDQSSVDLSSLTITAVPID